MIKNFLCIVAFVLNSFAGFSTNLDIRVLNDIHLTSLIVSPISGEYIIIADGIAIADSNKVHIFQLVLDGDSIVLKTLEKTIGKYSQLKFIGRGISPIIKIKSVIPIGKIRSYDNNLEVSVLNNGLKVINDVELETYISGVVEGESGGTTTLEYYKLQSILCRTYA